MPLDPLSHGSFVITGRTTKPVLTDPYAATVIEVDEISIDGVDKLESMVAGGAMTALKAAIKDAIQDITLEV